MKTYRFRCTLLSEVVVNASAATEGAPACLDFVPGANFLGIVAAKYDEFGDDAFRIFHSGDVSFGDAHPVAAGTNTRALRPPLAWMLPKGDNSPIYLGHRIDWDRIKERDLQLRQVREDYFVAVNEPGGPPAIKRLKVPSRFSVKSAYDAARRRSEDARMYGYTALAPDTVWEFVVRAAEDIDFQRIMHALVGERRIGRSRSAQYGLCRIEYVGAGIDPGGSRDSDVPDRIVDECVLYAESRLAFLDEYGMPTARPTAEQLGVRNGRIDWEKSQVRTATYAPWNRRRKGRDPDRWVIEKGSVFVLRPASEDAPMVIDAEKIPRGVGLYLCEGFGRLLVNPPWLAPPDGADRINNVSEDQPLTAATSSRLPAPVKTAPEAAAVRDWIIRQQKETEVRRKIYAVVAEFIQKEGPRYSGEGGISPSQWGQVRRIAERARSHEDLCANLFGKASPEEGFLHHGRTQRVWNRKARAKTLEKWLNDHRELSPLLCVRLAAEMARRSRGTDSN